MSEKKIKPPRPPAPVTKVKKNTKKSNHNGPSFSFHFHKEGDIEDEEDLGVSMLTNSKKVLYKEKTDTNIKLPSPKNESSSTEIIDDPLGVIRKTDYGSNDDIRKLEAEAFAQSATSKHKDLHKRTKAKETKKNDTGVIKITNEVIVVDDHNNFSIPSESKEAMSDPLTFVDKLQDDHRKKEATRIEDLKRAERQARIYAAEAEREKINDNLNVNPYYFNVPTPSEVPDAEPRRAQPDSAVAVSLSGLLEKSDESVRPKELLRKTSFSQTKESTPPKTPSEENFSDLERELSDVESPNGNEECNSILNLSQNTHLIPKYTLTIATLLMFCYMIFPLPPYLVGVITGMLISFYSLLFVIWLSLPETTREPTSLPDINDPLIIPGNRMPAQRARAKEQEKIFHQGWMNELPYEYDADVYHIQQTHSVFLRLDGTVLRLLQPKVNIPKRAMWDESLAKPVFENQRHVDLRGSNVYLEPQGLVAKRTWSKKYPICIKFEKKESEGLKVAKTCNNERMVLENELHGYDVITKEEYSDNNIIYLFARTGREKEEWFWKFETASKYKKIRGKKPIQTLNRNVYLRGNDLIRDDGSRHLYLLNPEDLASRKGAMDFYKYISKMLPKEKESTPQTVNVKVGGVTFGSSIRSSAAGIKTSPEGLAESPVSWANALLGRFFWDFLREEPSKDWVKNKLQKKLSKIRVPSFIDELTITDIDLGINSPVFRRMSRPHIDERGLWIDVDIAYSGSCCMTLETKVNLWKLKKGASLEKEMEEFIPGTKKMDLKKKKVPTATLR